MQRIERHKREGGDICIEVGVPTALYSGESRQAPRLPSCAGCTTAVEPRYVGTSFSCFYDSNTISLVSSNDFSGDVRLEVLNLPAGVTSQTATKLTVPRRGVASTPFKLQASGDAAVGDATVTVRATSGSIVHTLNLPISVADQLPSC
jgi:hypothetical protein